MYAISRVDSPGSRTHLWRVRIQRRRQQFVKSFSDGRYGGRQKALEAAQAYRDRLVVQLRPLTRRELCLIRKRSNRSGYVGVCRYDQHTGRADAQRKYWIATWTPVRGRPAKSVKFSVTRYGNRRALRLAVAARRKALLMIK